ncbi:hypothetical protein CXG81DRAFT_11584 [Caulochytrium protostelioides]|uniref:Guanine nucleotide binding protein, alpha subunit n=1 Tax=Caulochytrium protostelioides TaxID=1555241 RepID=A0A4P9X8X5_9FUNG|nr:guanine nucleotide binding protein, alpha subunit [Caulochytrium protostelioides]RKP01777.1 hypothetical protein CXG81DRAFT_11584 [Caulochytrium protostelioides]|eukprot:RKP01777.1 hypothetical protein CXG81DRAFT_11584 [Caulochytrium protostelioides]
MGCAQSAEDNEGAIRSSAIDKLLEEDVIKARTEYKILLLGAGESGKSTIVKQMKIIHAGGFSKEELASYQMIIYKNVIDSIQAIIEAASVLNIAFQNPESAELCSFIMSIQGDIDAAIVLEHGVSEKIAQLWQDPACQTIINGKHPQVYFIDSTAYFLDSLSRIAAPDYIPSEQDVLRSRTKTTGITETRFSMESLQIHMFDVGGQRSERRKWIHCFENVTSIIFCVALSEYDQTLLEESSQNRMAESLDLFESIVNSRWFLRTSIILFLNKIDIFTEKLKTVPLADFFPEYTGGNDVNKAAKFILWRFSHANRARLNVYPHLTQATDTANIRLVFGAVKVTILKNALTDTGMI